MVLECLGHLWPDGGWIQDEGCAVCYQQNTCNVLVDLERGEIWVHSFRGEAKTYCVIIKMGGGEIWVWAIFGFPPVLPPVNNDRSLIWYPIIQGFHGRIICTNFVHSTLIQRYLVPLGIIHYYDLVRSANYRGVIILIFRYSCSGVVYF